MRFAVLVASADDKDLVLTEFQLFLRPEGSNGCGQRSDKAGMGPIEILANMWRFVSGKLTV